ncbi:MAG: hypothetical protein IPL26_04670 [Leptospiraceae bacterium]|nr:hypothetical protein [Leptospiraceae bacterium]
MKYLSFLDKFSYTNLLIASALLGLAPFFPIPHSIEKIQMLSKGELTKLIDIGDLIFHLSPVLILGLKYFYSTNSSDL